MAYQGDMLGCVYTGNYCYLQDPGRTESLCYIEAHCPQGKHIARGKDLFFVKSKVKNHILY